MTTQAGEVLTRTVIAAVSAVGAAVLFAVPAGAEPGDNPCQFSISFICRFVPMAPDLEGDIDLTQQQPPVDPAAPLPEVPLPANICSNGCV
ncbi:MAG: hypothetical protein QOK02_5847 [Mycobacterium sp.]|nr:hypothetical protein [Mycobacterium sp.]